MKKLLTFIALFLSFGVFAQSGFIQGGVSAGVGGYISENAEIGVQGGKNRVSLVGQSFDTSSLQRRQYLLGVKYSRNFASFSNFAASLSLAGKTNLSEVGAFVIEPGAAINTEIANDVVIVTGVSVPFKQTKFDTRKSSFSGNVALRVIL